jgi:hypothetical protein
MRLDFLIDRLLDTIGREQRMLRRVARYLFPLLLLPIGFALAQMTRSWVGLLVGGLAVGVLLSQIEFFLRPTLARGRSSDHDMTYYLGLEPADEPPSLAAAVPLLIPAALMLTLSMALFLPTILAAAATWQRLLALMLGILVLWLLWQRVATISVLLSRLERRLISARADMHAPAPPSSPPSPQDGLLDPHISARVARLPLPPLRLSPAALALLRVEAYLMLQEAPDRPESEVLTALHELAREAFVDEERHGFLPPIGGKIYFPVTADGVLAMMLAATARRLGMDGAYSASLGTWLLRLPPARSYRVAGRLIDAVIALRLLPDGAIMPHHLTVQGDLGQESRILSLIHLASTPLLFDERPGQSGGDERPFIMRGGGVLDDMGGRGRYTGARTDFVDGFLIVSAPNLHGVEHLTGHTINLCIKQVLAFGLQSAARSPDRRSPMEQTAAQTYLRFRNALLELLQRYDLAGALDVDWLDGQWSDVWPFILRMSRLKEHDPHFMRQAQALRDETLDALERVAVSASGVL